MPQLRAEDEAVAKSCKASSDKIEDRLDEVGVQGELAIKAAEAGEAGRIPLCHLQELIPETSTPPTAIDSLKVGARLKHFAKDWEDITSDQWVLGTLREGLKLKFKTLPTLSQIPIEISLPKDPSKREALLGEISVMLEKGAIERVSQSDPGFYSHIFIRTKKSGGLRPIIDLKALNKHLSVPHFKMETAQSIRQQISPLDWVVTLDMKDAYFHIPVHKDFQKYLKFSIQGVVYQFIAMCFGLAPAPLIFTKVFREFAAYLHKLAILIHLFLDDWLIRNKSPKLLLAQLETVLKLAKKLGIMINWDKSDLEPKQTFIHLGLQFVLPASLVFPTEEAIGKILRWSKYLKQHKKITAKAFLSFLGLLSHTCNMIRMGRLNIRPLQFYLNSRWHAQKEPLKKIISLDGTFFRYLTWWENTDNTLAGAPLHAPHTSFTVFTDASTLSWGGHLNSQVVSGMWSKVEKKLHINLLEMKAILLTLMHFVHMINNHCILIMSDNTTVVSYINKQGGTHSWSQFLMTQELFQWTERHNISV
jgi:hypothetical protein